MGPLRLGFSLCAVCFFGMVLCVPTVRAADLSQDEKIAKLNALQEKQGQLQWEYEEQKEELLRKLQEILTDYKEEPGKPSRQEAITANQQQQKESRQDFQNELRKLQREERKIRFGRESLTRPDLEEAEREANEQALEDKQKRLDLQRRREAQDQQINEEMKPRRRILPPAPPLTSSPPPAAPIQPPSTKNKPVPQSFNQESEH